MICSLLSNNSVWGKSHLYSSLMMSQHSIRIMGESAFGSMRTRVHWERKVEDKDFMFLTIWLQLEDWMMVMSVKHSNVVGIYGGLGNWWWSSIPIRLFQPLRELFLDVKHCLPSIMQSAIRNMPLMHFVLAIWILHQVGKIQYQCEMGGLFKQTGQGRFKNSQWCCQMVAWRVCGLFYKKEAFGQLDVSFLPNVKFLVRLLELLSLILPANMQAMLAVVLVLFCPSSLIFKHKKGNYRKL